MKIIKIKKKNKKYEIELENNDKITTFDDVIIKYNILYHKEIDEQLLYKIKQENNFYEAYNNAIAYISKRLRSEKEIRTYLKKHDLSENDEEKIIEKLKKINLLNDELFVKAFINDKISFTSYGPLKIKKELEEEQIDESIIDNFLEQIDEEIFKDKALKLIEKKLKQNKKYTNNILKQKIMFELINQGYPKEIIVSQLNRIDLKNDVTEVYNKYYKKLSTKYSGKDLEFRILQKLYALGYTKEDIDALKNNQL